MYSGSYKCNNTNVMANTMFTYSWLKFFTMLCYHYVCSDAVTYVQTHNIDVFDSERPNPCAAYWCVLFRKVSCTRSFSAEVNRPGREVVHPPPWSEKVTNVWSCTSTVLACTVTPLRLIKGGRVSIGTGMHSGARRSVCVRTRARVSVLRSWTVLWKWAGVLGNEV